MKIFLLSNLKTWAAKYIANLKGGKKMRIVKDVAEWIAAFAAVAGMYAMILAGILIAYGT
jgi:hypothetical protein